MSRNSTLSPSGALPGMPRNAGTCSQLALFRLPILIPASSPQTVACRRTAAEPGASSALTDVAAHAHSRLGLQVEHVHLDRIESFGRDKRRRGKTRSYLQELKGCSGRSGSGKRQRHRERSGRRSELQSRDDERNRLGSRKRLLTITRNPSNNLDRTISPRVSLRQKNLIVKLRNQPASTTAVGQKYRVVRHAQNAVRHWNICSSAQAVR